MIFCGEHGECCHRPPLYAGRRIETLLLGSSKPYNNSRGVATCKLFIYSAWLSEAQFASTALLLSEWDGFLSRLILKVNVFTPYYPSSCHFLPATPLGCIRWKGENSRTPGASSVAEAISTTPFASHGHARPRSADQSSRIDWPIQFDGATIRANAHAGSGLKEKSNVYRRFQLQEFTVAPGHFSR